MDAFIAVLLVIRDWGAVPLCGALIYVVLHLVKKIDENTKNSEERDSKFRDAINKTLNGFGERLSLIEKDYVKNEVFYQNLSGWRSEINRVSDQINNLSMNLLQSIAQFFSKGN